jgi:two-component system OmpR family sensor kinase
MGRLFWKFFAAFWVGLATVALIVAAGVWLARWFDLVPVSRVELGRMNFYLQTTRGLIQMGDMAAVRHIGGAVDDETHAAPYVIDSQGRDLLGRPLAPELWSQIQTAPEQLDLADARRGLGALQRVAMPDGSVVTVFAPAALVRTALGKASEKTPPPFWLPILATVLISTLFGGFMAWYVSHPIRTLQWALQRVAVGQLDTRVQGLMGRRRDELAELGADFDRMAQRMQLLVGAQQRLLHDVSHELRSPLARMQAAIGLARQQPERAAAMQDRVERESTRLDALVGELLTLARLETDATPTAHARLDVVELLAEVCDDARFEARAAKRDLVFTANGGYLAEVSSELLYRAFENVVRNAVKFTREGTVVSVVAEVRSTSLVVTVSDQGPGVPAEAHAQMFEPFQRVGDAGVDGFGLGLTIAKRAIESHGGRIEAHAAAGGGLAIRMSLGRVDLLDPLAA